MLRILLVAAVLGVSAGLFFFKNSRTAVEAAGAKIENFALYDHQGGFFELWRKSYWKGVVLISHGCECPMMRKQLPYIEGLKAKYAARGIGFVFINPQDTAKDIQEEAAKYGVTIPVLLDDGQFISRGLQITRTLEAILISTKTWQTVYRGAISDELSFDGDRPAPQEEYLSRAIDDFLAGRRPAVAMTDLKGGCAYSYKQWPEITYHRDVKHILFRNCTGCHTTFGAPPTKLSTYAEARQWGQMIREVIRTNRMPLGTADPNFGPFEKVNLPALERATLVQWVESGMAEGSPGRATAAVREFKKPRLKADLRFDMREVVKVPPRGEFAASLYPLGEAHRDLWIDSYQLQLEDPNQVHHVHLLILPPALAQAQKTGLESESLAMKDYANRTSSILGFSIGRLVTRPVAMPKGSAVFVPKGSHLMLDIHHAKTGKWENFKAGVALSLAKCGKTYAPIHHGALYETNVRIPALAPAHRILSQKEIGEDIEVHNVAFHMHKRGSGMKLSFEFPNGEIHPVYSVPNYKSVYQRGFTLNPPLRVPRGSKLLLEAVYDNSVGNPAITNPNAEIREGLDNDTHEMMKLVYLYSVEGEPRHKENCVARR